MKELREIRNWGWFGDDRARDAIEDLVIRWVWIKIWNMFRFQPSIHIQTGGLYRAWSWTWFRPCGIEQ